jgi:hypothetical protein
MAPASAAPDGTVLAYSNIAFCHAITDGIGGDCNGLNAHEELMLLRGTRRQQRTLLSL